MSRSGLGLLLEEKIKPVAPSCFRVTFTIFYRFFLGFLANSRNKKGILKDDPLPREQVSDFHVSCFTNERMKDCTCWL